MTPPPKPPLPPEKFMALEEGAEAQLLKVTVGAAAAGLAKTFIFSVSFWGCAGAGFTVAEELVFMFEAKSIDKLSSAGFPRLF
jgi:hypothetical protein